MAYPDRMLFAQLRREPARQLYRALLPGLARAAPGSVNMLSTVPSGSGIDCASTSMAGYSSPLSQCVPEETLGRDIPVVPLNANSKAAVS